MVVFRVREMTRRKLSPSEIVERLRVVDELAADGQPIADALLFAGMLQAEYDRWRSEYAGIIRTLGPLADGSPKKKKKPFR